jgi:hypothetical protein
MTTLVIQDTSDKNKTMKFFMDVYNMNEKESIKTVDNLPFRDKDWDENDAYWNWKLEESSSNFYILDEKL